MHPKLGATLKQMVQLIGHKKLEITAILPPHHKTTATHHQVGHDTTVVSTNNSSLTAANYWPVHHGGLCHLHIPNVLRREWGNESNSMTL
jgi:hypothetical protein